MVALFSSREDEGPHSIDHDGPSVIIRELTKKCASLGIEHADLAAVNFAYQQLGLAHPNPDGAITTSHGASSGPPGGLAAKRSKMFPSVSKTSTTPPSRGVKPAYVTYTRPFTMRAE